MELEDFEVLDGPWVSQKPSKPSKLQNPKDFLQVLNIQKL